VKAKLLGILLIGFLAGTAAGTFFNYDISNFFIAAIAFFLVMSVATKKWIHIFVSLAAIFIFAGFEMGCNAANFKIKSEPTSISGFIAKVDQNIYQKSINFYVKEKEKDSYLEVRTGKDVEYKVGDYVLISGNITAADLPKYKKDHIYYFVQYPEIRKIKKPNSGRYENFLVKKAILINRLNEYISDRISAVLPQPHAALSVGVLLGGSSAFSKDLSSKFSDTGITHILAVSGYNVMIIATVLFKFLKKKPQKIKIWGAIFGVWVFAVLTGMSSSVVRASIMASVLIIAKLAGRDYYPFSSLMLTASIMVFLNPLILMYDLGFQLSFLAVLGIIYFGPLVGLMFKKRNIFTEIIIATISAQILTMPLIAYYFGKVSIVSFAANLLVLPAIPFLMLFSFITFAVYLVSPFLALGVGFFNWVLAEYVVKTILYLSSLPWAKVNIEFGFTALIVVYILLIDIKILSLRYAKKKKENLHDYYSLAG